MAEQERNPTVKEIVKQFLELNGFDGLFNEDAPCACKLDELITCDDYCSDCEAGYLVPCEEEWEGEFNYCIGREKPE
jgi:hypothetical protein